MEKTNPMRQIKISKVTLNIGCGTDQKKMDRAILLIQQLTGITPVKTKTDRRLAAWQLRPGLPIGVKTTLRGKEAEKLFERCLAAKDKKLKESMFDDNGNVSFGIHEYIDIPGSQYDPKIGILGLQVTATLTRPGFRIKTRKVQPARIPTRHRISRQDAIGFAAEKFKIKVE